VHGTELGALAVMQKPKKNKGLFTAAKQPSQRDRRGGKHGVSECCMQACGCCVFAGVFAGVYAYVRAYVHRICALLRICSAYMLCVRALCTSGCANALCMYVCECALRMCSTDVCV